MDDQADNIRNRFQVYNLLITMKRCTHHIVLVGNNGSLCAINLPNLHKPTGLYHSHAAFIYPGELASNLSFPGC